MYNCFWEECSCSLEKHKKYVGVKGHGIYNIFLQDSGESKVK